MSAVLQHLVNQPYKHGFVTDIEADIAPKGLNEDIIRLISSKRMNLNGYLHSGWRLTGSGSIWSSLPGRTSNIPKSTFRTSVITGTQTEEKACQYG